MRERRHIAFAAAVRLGLAVLAAAVVLPAASEETVDGEETEKAESDEKPPEVLARVDIANSGDGSLPGGTTRKEGAWSVVADAEKLRLAPEPLVVGWLEFGPEIRERPATVVATARAPGDGRIQSRMGVGLYGENGFQLRAVLVRDEVELVRRGAVLLRRSFPLEPGEFHDMELAVGEEEDEWVLTGRVWRHEEDRPAEPLFRRRVFFDELKFPLAGRTALVATPFAGEPVDYSAARVYDGVYAPPEEDGEADGGESEAEGEEEEAEREDSESDEESASE